MKLLNLTCFRHSTEPTTRKGPYQGGGRPAKAMEPRKGLVTAICGPMFSGKTTRLLDYASRWREVPDTSVCLVKHSDGTGLIPNVVTTHAGIERRADLIAETMSQVVSFTKLRKTDVVAIDEGKQSD